MAQPAANSRFADISGLTGLDFPDDGRAIAVHDWDHDGDLDVWTTNRNAPRLRLLRNDSRSGHHFLAIRLIGNGTTSNRDAIGARIEVVVSATDAGQRSHRLVRTLRAGDAFLAQSSKWLHYGLGRATTVESLEVRWPDGSRESVGPLRADRRYEVVQGSGEAVAVPPRTHQPTLQPGSPPALAPQSNVRLPLPIPMRIPDLSYLTFAGDEADVPVGGSPLLLNLWASWCQPCLVELRDWADRYDELRGEGIRLLALSVDGLDPDLSDRPDGARLAEKLKLPFPTGFATREVVGLLHLLHDQVSHSRRPLPVPTSILFDSEGRMSVLYKGGLPVKQLMHDARVRTATEPDDRALQRAAMLPGHHVDSPLLTAAIRRVHAFALFQTASAMQRLGHSDDAVSLYQDAIANHPRFARARNNLGHLYSQLKRFDEAEKQFREALIAEPQLVEALNSWGIALQAQGRLEEAAARYEAAAIADPDFAEAFNNWGVTLRQMGRPAEALERLTESVRIEPRASAHYRLGNILYDLKRYDEAHTQFTMALHRDPKHAGAQRELGRTLLALGRVPEAIATLRETMSRFGKTAAAHHNLGHAYRTAGELANAAAEFEAAVNIDPNFALAHQGLGATLQAQGKVDEALDAFRRAVAIDPDLFPAQLSCGRLLELRGQTALAIPFYQEAVRIDPGSSTAHRHMAEALAVNQQFGPSTSHWQRCLEIDPRDPEALNGFAWLLATCRDGKFRDGNRAVALARQAAELTDFQRASPLDTLAAACAEVGDFAEACRWQAQAIELAPVAHRDDLEQRLTLYRGGMPFHEP